MIGEYCSYAVIFVVPGTKENKGVSFAADEEEARAIAEDYVAGYGSDSYAFVLKTQAVCESFDVRWVEDDGE